MLEVGVQGGYLFVVGEIDCELGYVYGLYFCKVIDYLFFFCLDFIMGIVKGMGCDNNNLWEFENSWIFGFIFGVFSLNSVCLDCIKKKMNFYVMVGVGVNFYIVDFKMLGMIFGVLCIDMVESVIVFYVVVGVGIFFCLSNKINVGFEYQVFGLFGICNDLLDGINKEEIGNCLVVGDIFNWISL